MNNMFKNPWGKGGELYPDEVLNNNFELNSDIESDDSSHIISHIQSLNNFGDNGFTSIKLNDGTIVSIPIYYKVSNVKFNRDKTREEFILKEWPYENQIGSVKCEKIGVSRFSAIIYENSAKIYLNKVKGELKFDTTVVPAYTYVDDPIPNGTHNIWLPDYPHDYGSPYLNSTKYALIWFRLGLESSHRYLHVGNVSAGCVSVGKSKYDDNTPQNELWTQIYQYLSKKRTNSKFVGTLIVS